MDGRIPSSASSSRDRSPPESDPDLLEHVVAAEQEPGEVAARLAGGHRDRLEDRLEDRGAGDRGVAQLGEIATATTWWPKITLPSSGGRSPAIVRSSVVLPAPFGPTIPIRSPRCAARNGAFATVTGPAASVPSGGQRPAARQVADLEVLDPDHELARAHRPAARARRRGA